MRYAIVAAVLAVVACNYNKAKSVGLYDFVETNHQVDFQVSRIENTEAVCYLTSRGGITCLRKTN
mgnify:CR=1 FL=1